MIDFTVFEKKKKTHWNSTVEHGQHCIEKKNSPEIEQRLLL